MTSKKTIAVDFDGVIHRYSKGWQDGSIYDPPMPGAMESLVTLLNKYCVFIHTTRHPDQVVKWLLSRPELFPYDIASDRDEDIDITSGFWNTPNVLLVTNRKLVAIAFIDDRAIKFTNWDQTMLEVGELY